MLRKRWKLLASAAGFLLFFFWFRSVMILLILGFAVMTVDYFLHMSRFPIHLDPLFFISIIITKTYGMGTAAVFCIVTGIVPEILSGSFELSDSLEFIPILSIAALSTLIPGMNLLYGTILSIIYAFSQAGLARLLGEQPLKVYIEPWIVLGMNVLLFWNLTDVLFLLIGY